MSKSQPYVSRMDSVDKFINTALVGTGTIGGGAVLYKGIGNLTGNWVSDIWIFGTCALIVGLGAFCLYKK